MSKETGLEERFHVRRRIIVDGVVDLEPAKPGVYLQFDDPLARKGIEAWSRAVREEGYTQLADDVDAKLEEWL